MSRKGLKARKQATNRVNKIERMYERLGVIGSAIVKVD